MIEWNPKMLEEFWSTLEQPDRKDIPTKKDLEAYAGIVRAYPLFDFAGSAEVALVEQIQEFLREQRDDLKPSSLVGSLFERPSNSKFVTLARKPNLRSRTPELARALQQAKLYVRDMQTLEGKACEEVIEKLGRLIPQMAGPDRLPPSEAMVKMLKDLIFKKDSVGMQKKILQTLQAIVPSLDDEDLDHIVSMVQDFLNHSLRGEDVGLTCMATIVYGDMVPKLSVIGRSTYAFELNSVLVSKNPVVLLVGLEVTEKILKSLTPDDHGHFLSALEKLLDHPMPEVRDGAYALMVKIAPNHPAIGRILKMQKILRQRNECLGFLRGEDKEAKIQSVGKLENLMPQLKEEEYHKTCRYLLGLLRGEQDREVCCKVLDLLKSVKFDSGVFREIASGIADYFKSKLLYDNDADRDAHLNAYLGAYALEVYTQLVLKISEDDRKRDYACAILSIFDKSTRPLFLLNGISAIKQIYPDSQDGLVFEEADKIILAMRKLSRHENGHVRHAAVLWLDNRGFSITDPERLERISEMYDSQGGLKEKPRGPTGDFHTKKTDPVNAGPILNALHIGEVAQELPGPSRTVEVEEEAIVEMQADPLHIVERRVIASYQREGNSEELMSFSELKDYFIQREDPIGDMVRVLNEKEVQLAVLYFRAFNGSQITGLTLLINKVAREFLEAEDTLPRESALIFGAQALGFPFIRADGNEAQELARTYNGKKGRGGSHSGSQGPGSPRKPSGGGLSARSLLRMVPQHGTREGHRNPYGVKPAFHGYAPISRFSTLPRYSPLTRGIFRFVR